MLKSKTAEENEKNEFTLIRDPKHIASVWATMKKNINLDFEKLLEGKGDFQKGFAIKTFFDKGIENYKKKQPKYEKMFSERRLEEYGDDLKYFRARLEKDCPIIRSLLLVNSKTPQEIKDWQVRYKTTETSTIGDIFLNVIDLKEEFIETNLKKDYTKHDDVDPLKLLKELSEVEDYSIPGVVGIGIKSIILYHLNSSYFMDCVRFTLYGYCFLTDNKSLGLPTQTNEFIIIDDTKKRGRNSDFNILIDHNYWYPFDLFMLYSLRSLRELRKLCSNHGYQFRDEYRFVYLHHFLTEHICQLNIEKIKTMMGSDQKLEAI